VLLARIQPLIDLIRRPEQSGFSWVLLLAVPQATLYWNCVYCQNYTESSIAH